MPIDLELVNRVTLVVGGGGGGIGSSVCRRLAEAGSGIVALSLVAEDLAETAAEVAGLGCYVSTHQVDVADVGALRAAIADAAVALAAHDGRVIDGVVNVVGGATPPHWHRLLDYPQDSLDHLIDTNLRYALVSCQEVAKGLVAAGRRGSMVNISSIASRGQPLLSGYGAAKAGLDSLCRSMASEWGRFGIRVNNVAPGTINTPRSGRDADAVDPAAAAIPLGRRGHPDDIANAAVFLLSDLASYISGQTIDVDGGPSRGGLDDSDLPVFVTNPAIRQRFEDEV